MQQLSYIKLNRPETRDLLAQLNPHLDMSDLKAENADILSASLHFYPGYRLLEITDRAATPIRKRFVIYKRDHFVVMDFTNTPIYELNKKVPIVLNKDTLFDYIRFFFRFVRGRHGRFLVVEGVDDIQWREDPAPNARRSLAEMINPLDIANITADGSYEVAANVIFKDALFGCTITVAANGIIRLSNEKLLVEALPVVDDILGA